MGKKFSEGRWVLGRDFVSTVLGEVICDIAPIGVSKKVYTMSTEETKANAKLIAAAPNMLDALLETDKDLCVLESTMAQIESTDPRAEGMTELVKKWRERNKLAINKATE